MDRLPSKIMFDIFSRMPVKCLARSRCVSKVWCEYIDDGYLTIIHHERVIEEPTPILYHTRLSHDHRIARSLCFHVIESKHTGTPDHTYVLGLKQGPFLEFLQKKPISESSYVEIEVRGSCNGLMFLTQVESNVVTSLVVVHPLRKECYKVPPLPMRFDRRMFRQSCCGLGFDASTNTLKMVCVLFKDRPPRGGDLDMMRKNLCTMVHVLGTNSWREIPQVSPYCITGGVVYANGFLHWFVSVIDIKTQYGARPVIWFDVEKEEFGLIDPPKRMCDLWRNYSCRYDQLVDLNGEVGYVCTGTMEVWLLNDKKEWVPHCRIKREILPNGYVEILGCWNKDGDMLIKNLANNERSLSYAYCVLEVLKLLKAVSDGDVTLKSY
ncbi:F-box domain containing protein [Tanacetum coccineum]